MSMSPLGDSPGGNAGGVTGSPGDWMGNSSVLQPSPMGGAESQAGSLSQPQGTEPIMDLVKSMVGGNMGGGAM